MQRVGQAWTEIREGERERRDQGRDKIEKRGKKKKKRRFQCPYREYLTGEENR